MLQALDAVRLHSETANIYTGRDVLLPEREELRSLEPTADGSQEARLRLAVGDDELRLGNNAQAIEHLKASYELSDRADGEAAFRLAVAYMRMAEAQNCLAHADPRSCILPIREGGVHRDPSHSEEAIRVLGALLERRPSHIEARWLLNLAFMTLGRYPAEVPRHLLIPPKSFESEASHQPFRNIAGEVGLGTVSLSGGAVADDFDGDGRLDILASDWSPHGQLRFFRNQGGTFVDSTADANLEGLYGGLNMIQADYDNDGDLDVLVLRGAWLEEAGLSYPNSLLSNDGKGRFTDVTKAVGLAETHYPTQAAAWADYDNDGDLDLFIGNEHFPSQLFRNDGDGSFVDTAVEAGVTNDDFAKAAVWGDYDDDGFPDLYVSNFGGLNRLYRNNGDGTFADVAFSLGVEAPLRSFPAWFWDFDNDGNLDLFVSGYEWDVRDVAADHMGLPAIATELDRIYRGSGSGSFEEVGKSMGLTRITQPMGANFGDVDNDGFLDFYLGTGYPAYEGLMPNLLFRNEGGNGFADISAAAGVGHLQKGHGVAFLDFDQDGDQDLFVELGGAYAGDVFSNALFENPGTRNGWIVVRLEGVASNRSAIGARIRVDIEEEGVRRSIFRWVNSGGSFGANPLRQHIGLGSASRVETLEIHWPTTGQTQEFHQIDARQFVALREDSSEYVVLAYPPR